MYTKFKNAFIFIFPTLIILSQWFSVAGINISWVITILITLLVMYKIENILNNKLLFILFIIVMISPIINFLFSYASNFNTSLYISTITGLFCLMYICIIEKNEFNIFFHGILFSCVIFTGWAIFEIFTGRYLIANNLFFMTTLNDAGMHYPLVAFVNINDLSQYLVIAFTITGVILFKRNRIIYFFLAMSILFVVFHTSSKLSMISLVLSMVLTYLIHSLFAGNLNNLFKILGLGILALIAIITFDTHTGYISDIIDNFLVVDTNADYYQGRYDIYINLLKTGVTLPLGGFGTSYAIQSIPPHNLFLFILCDYGWIPVLLYFVLLFRLLITFLTKSKADDKIDSAFITSALIVFLIMSNVSSCNEQRKIIWMALGIFIRFYFLYRKKDEFENEKIKS